LRGWPSPATFDATPFGQCFRHVPYSTARLAVVLPGSSPNQTEVAGSATGIPRLLAYSGGVGVAGEARFDLKGTSARRSLSPAGSFADTNSLQCGGEGWGEGDTDWPGGRRGRSPHPPFGHLLPHSHALSCFSAPIVGEKGRVVGLVPFRGFATYLRTRILAPARHVGPQLGDNHSLPPYKGLAENPTYACAMRPVTQDNRNPARARLNSG
jgi:hypothetical protein